LIFFSQINFHFS